MHLYTACGTVLALLIVLAAIDGDVVRALWLGLAALVIDGTDGLLARWLRVKERIPWFDGARLDDIVDYLTYVFAPVVLLWTAGYLPSGGWGMTLAALPLLASSYQFCRTDAKTDDHFFLGFPSYWNVVAFYAVVLNWSAGDGRRRPGRLRGAGVRARALPLPLADEVLWRLNIALTVVWLASYAVILLQMPHPHAGVDRALRRLPRLLRRAEPVPHGQGGSRAAVVGRGARLSNGAAVRPRRCGAPRSQSDPRPEQTTSVSPGSRRGTARSVPGR